MYASLSRALSEEHTNDSVVSGCPTVRDIGRRGHRTKEEQDKAASAAVPPRRWPGVALLTALLVVVLAATWLGGRGGGFLRLRREAALGLEEGRAPFECPPNGGTQAPAVWKPHTEGEEMQVKVLTYNLFWWSLFRKRGGNGGSASRLIAAHMDPPFDLMGFQECEDLWRVLAEAGLLDQYNVIKGPYAKCMAFRKTGWFQLANGAVDVAEDTYWNWFGKRGVQWLRVQHEASGKKVFFMNFHGPLSVNSGGKCGGWTTAQNLLKVVRDHGQEGDTVIFVGDFNANSASTLLQSLRMSLLHVYNGDVFGGIDNFFSNLNSESIVGTSSLGKGGSDHDALSVTFRVGASSGTGTEAKGIKGALDSLSRAVQDLGHSSTCDCDCSWNQTKGACDHFDDSCCGNCCCGEMKHTNKRTAKGALCERAPIDWSVFWCGLTENNAEYVFEPGGWEQYQEHINPDWCCKRCQEAPECGSWSWNAYPNQPHNNTVMGHCHLKGGAPTDKRWTYGFASGRSAAPALALARQQKATAF